VRGTEGEKCICRFLISVEILGDSFRAPDGYFKKFGEVFKKFYAKLLETIVPNIFSLSPCDVRLRLVANWENPDDEKVRSCCTHFCTGLFFYIWH
jgi:hypothetical protein